LQDHKAPNVGWIKYLVGGVCFLVDFASKDWARTSLATIGELPFIPGFLRFNLVTNTGAAFNLGSGHAIVMTIIATAVTTLLVVWVMKEERRAVAGKALINIGAGFLVGGAVGNLADRFLRGRVTDFIEFAFFRFPVFNCADVCIDIGVGLLIIAAWRNRKAAKSASTSAGSDKEGAGPSSLSNAEDQKI
jgi:signal peptidase II